MTGYPPLPQLLPRSPLKSVGIDLQMISSGNLSPQFSRAHPGLTHHVLAALHIAGGVAPYPLGKRGASGAINAQAE